MKRKQRHADSDDDYREEESSASSSEGEPDWQQSAQRFVGYLRAWMQANMDRLIGAYRSNRGWETWLHVELYLYIKAQNAHAAIAREPNAYPGKAQGLRADFLFEGVTVEIKAESGPQAVKAFADGVNKDVVKLKNLPTGAAIVIGVCWSDEAADELAKVVETNQRVDAANGYAYFGYTADSA